MINDQETYRDQVKREFAEREAGERGRLELRLKEILEPGKHAARSSVRLCLGLQRFSRLGGLGGPCPAAKLE